MKAIFLGLSTVDIFNFVSHYPKGNAKLKAKSQLMFAGGPATNAAVTFAAMGNDATLISGLGDNPIASISKNDLKTSNVALHDIITDINAIPIISTINVDLSNGDRSVIYSETHGQKLDVEKITKQLLEGVELVMLDGYFMNAAIHISRLAINLNIPVVLDGGSWKEGMEELLPNISHAICSNNFITPGSTSTQNTIDYLVKKGIKKIAISRGSEPIIAYENGSTFEIEVPSVNVIDTLGAGDILHGAFCHFILQNGNFKTSLAKAADISSRSCTFYGTREWIKYLH